MLVSINTHPDYKPSKEIMKAEFDKATQAHRKTMEEFRNIMDRINARQKGKH